jgi:murein L,D-transpeptidase YafK
MKTLLILNSFLCVLILSSTSNAAPAAAAPPKKRQFSRCFYFDYGVPPSTKAIPLPTVDYLLVSKSQKKMVALSKYTVTRVYDIALGRNSVGHKVQEGDFKTPIGFYKISGKNPKSDFNLSMQVSYPNKVDRENAESLGVSPGGEIMVHGLPKDGRWADLVRVVHPLVNWTRGCIAVTDAEIEELYPKVAVNTTIEICE